MLIIGDSHAAMIVPAFAEVARRHDMSLYVSTSNSCTWQEDSYVDNPNEGRGKACIELHDLTYGSQMDVLDPDVVIVAGFPRTLGTRTLIRTTRADLEGSDPAALVEVLSTESVERFIADGRRTVLVEPIPIPNPPRQDQLSCLSEASFVEECVNEATPSEAEERVYRDLARNSSSVMAIDLDRLVCPELPLCAPIVDGVVVRTDTDHLSVSFVETLVGPIEALMIGEGFITS
jgi:hypothetical protein